MEETKTQEQTSAHTQEKTVESTMVQHTQKELDEKFIARAAQGGEAAMKKFRETDEYKSFTKYQDDQKTATEKAQEQTTGYETDRSAWKVQESNYQAQLAGHKLGINSDSLSDAITLATPLLNDKVTMEEALKTVSEKYPNFLKEQAEQTDPKKSVVKFGKEEKPDQIKDKKTTMGKGKW